MSEKITNGENTQSRGLTSAGVLGRGRGDAAVRIGFGVIWAIAAWLKWQPSFRTTFLPNMISTAAGQPHWLAPWFDFWLRLERPAPGVWVYLGAIAETAIAIAVILGFARRAVYIGGALYSGLVWATAGGFGAPYAQGATDIGPAIIYAVVFCALLVILEHGLGSRFAVDAAIARRLLWWPRIAGPSGLHPS